MKLGKILVISGGIIMFFGILFYLQGIAIVGPSSSFMYSNPDWITYGLEIAITGIIILAIGIGFIIKN